MNQMVNLPIDNKYQKCIDTSKRIRWEIDTDVIRGRSFDGNEKFLPDGLSMCADASFLSDKERLLISQIQGRTYANMFGLVERFINLKILELSQDHVHTDQTAHKALMGFSDEEIKHQKLFKRVDLLCAEVMPDGYSFDWVPNDIADVVLSKSSWAVLALTLHIELFTQAHYRESIDNDKNVSELFRDVFKYHWIEESQHAIIDELEFRRIHEQLSLDELDTGVDEFIELVCAVDGILNGQAQADAEYFAKVTDRDIPDSEQEEVCQLFLRAYRWQYILSGAQHPHFQKVLGEMLTVNHGNKIASALATLI